jgi:hypothetical protein
MLTNLTELVIRLRDKCERAGCFPDVREVERMIDCEYGDAEREVRIARLLIQEWMTLWLSNPVPLEQARAFLERTAWAEPEVASVAAAEARMKEGPSWE